MTNKNYDFIDIDLIVNNIDKDLGPKIKTLYDVLYKIENYEDKFVKEKKRIKSTIKKLEAERKFRITLELFLMSDFTMSCRIMEEYLKEKSKSNPNVPIISKSAIDRYLRDEMLIKAIYSDNIYDEILKRRIEITENGRIKGGKSFQEIYQTGKDEHGYFNGKLNDR